MSDGLEQCSLSFLYKFSNYFSDERSEELKLLPLRRAKRGARSNELLNQQVVSLLIKFYKAFTSEASKSFVLRRATERGPDRDLSKERGASNLEAKAPSLRGALAS